MIKSICGANCSECEMNTKCKGCVESKGCPFGKQCFIAKYITIGGQEQYRVFKEKLIEEFNSLNIAGMPKITELYPLKGSFVNLAYPTPGGDTVKLLDDSQIYLGNQVECEFNDGTVARCYGLIAGSDFLLVSEYGEKGTNPEIVIYMKR